MDSGRRHDARVRIPSCIGLRVVVLRNPTHVLSALWKRGVLAGIPLGLYGTLPACCDTYTGGNCLSTKQTFTRCEECFLWQRRRGKHFTY